MTSSTTTAALRAETAVCDVLNQLYVAWAAADADGIAQLYTENATVVMPGVYHQSREDVRAFFTAGFAGRLRGSSATDEARSVRFASPDAAIVISTGGILMAGETSVPAQRLIRGTWVLVRQDGQWLIAAYHNCPLHVG
jgi:uncharacterized protein (TIGR02246 family)